MHAQNNSIGRQLYIPIPHIVSILRRRNQSGLTALLFYYNGNNKITINELLAVIVVDSFLEVENYVMRNKRISMCDIFAAAGAAVLWYCTKVVLTQRAVVLLKAILNVSAWI